MRDVDINGTTGNTKVVDKSKKTISISIGSAVIIIFIIAFLWHGSNQIEKKILGTWQNDEISEFHLTFSEDNSLIVNAGDMLMEGTYIFIDDNRIQLNFSYSLYNFVIYADVSVQGTTLGFDNIEEDSSEEIFISDKASFEKIK